MIVRSWIAQPRTFNHARFMESRPVDRTIFLFDHLIGNGEQ